MIMERILSTKMGQHKDAHNELFIKEGHCSFLLSIVGLVKDRVFKGPLFIMTHLPLNNADPSNFATWRMKLFKTFHSIHKPTHTHSLNTDQFIIHTHYYTTLLEKHFRYTPSDFKLQGEKLEALQLPYKLHL